MWVDELVEALTEKERPENSFSAREIAEQTGRSVQTCSFELRKRVARGELKRVMVSREYFYYK